ncbi:MAG: alpha/beta hydrolase family protein, partial [Gammaproteobacteria bacterium]
MLKPPKLFPALFAILALTACQPTSIQPTTEVERQPINTPYAVGNKTFFIHDKSRPYDSVGGVNVGVRSMITEIWYPVHHAVAGSGEYDHATYGDYVFGDKEVHRLMMTETTFFHLTPDSVVEGVSQAEIDDAINELFTRKRNSYKNAPQAAVNLPWPVVVMTHGDAGSRYNMESACEYLAAHGYVVIAPDHTGNSPYAFTGRDPQLTTRLGDVVPHLNDNGTYGSREKYGQTYTPLVRDRNNPQAMINMDNSLLQRVNDLRAALTMLDQMNAAGEFQGKLDLGKIGLMGRSFGGTTTLAGLLLESRFTAGVAVVPLVMPDIRSQFPPEVLKPAGQESVLLSADKGSSLNHITKPTMLLSGAEDGLIIGAGVGFAAAMGSEKPTTTNPLPALRKAYESSTQPVIWGLLKDSNHGSFGVSGPYWWPQYKTNTQRRFFAPDESFT